MDSVHRYSHSKREARGSIPLRVHKYCFLHCNYSLVDSSFSESLLELSYLFLPIYLYLYIYIYMIYTPRGENLILLLRFRKGSEAALEGVEREHLPPTPLQPLSLKLLAYI